jgi:hypothetical protein
MPNSAAKIIITTPLYCFQKLKQLIFQVSTGIIAYYEDVCAQERGTTKREIKI